MIFALKIIIALIAALVLIALAVRWMKKNTYAEKILRSLPANLVQEIADRIDDPGALRQFLSKFFKCEYNGTEKDVPDAASVLAELAPFPIPAEEQEDLQKVIQAISPEDLLAYAVQQTDSPAIITICHALNIEGYTVGIYQAKPEE